MKDYDPAGNPTSVTDPTERMTTYIYDPANRLTNIDYSDEKTPNVVYEYDADGNRTVMTDGTGTTTYTYDLLDRLVHNTDGHATAQATNTISRASKQNFSTPTASSSRAPSTTPDA